MENKYELPEDAPETDKINEPAIEYDYLAETDMKIQPPLTEDELRECITGDELREYMHQYIHELFNKK